MIPGTTLTPWIDLRLEMRPSPVAGQGLFALQPLQTGDVVIKWGGTVYTGAEVRAGKANPETMAVLDDDLYLADPAGEPPAGDYNLNHSCDPNVWMQDAITLVVRRPIAVDEELTADYALWLYGVDWRLDPCRCGSRLCRGRITSQDWRLPELQARYAGHFTPYLNHLILVKA
jgi:uncharacterized protein